MILFRNILTAGHSNISFNKSLYLTWASIPLSKPYAVTDAKAVNGSIPWHSYGVSLAIWDHTVLPATYYK